MKRPPLDQRPALCPRDDTCPAPSHDHAHAYHRGCISLAATEAWRLYSKRRREGRQPPACVSALGATRMLRALAVLGHTTRDITDRMGPGHSTAWLSQILRGERESITRGTDADIRRVFAALAMELGGSKHAAGRARAKGWAPPLAWDDIDDPRERPKLGKPTGDRRERVDLSADVARLTANGLSAPVIADRLDTTTRTVERYRARLATERAVA